MSKSSPRNNHADPLASLRGGPAPTSESTEHEDGDGVVWLDYRGRVGVGGELEHEGEWLIGRANGDPVALLPGLNLLPAETWEAIRELPAVAAKTGDYEPQLVRVDESLSQYRTRASFKSLCLRTRDPDALGLLHAREAARPISGPASDRRDVDLVAILAARAQAAARRGVLNLDGISQAARQRTQAATRKAS